MVNATARPLYPRERDPIPILQEAGLATGPGWTGAENLAPPKGFDYRTVQPVASRYTVYFLPGDQIIHGKEKRVEELDD